ncbi:hypothetical protein MTP99_003515 [Tenebrio molitor]|jgi:ubiquinol-cytochrome c reductase iron-sulfur subunit|uniref:cytochrome b-c1 complex subunit Rieske, mitochondrial-like n=1 Tax=Tenebrio molitor TaxID=7067 RepID=UPI002700769E|nr:hypothetical protein MTP99_003515 [Tenebrio molitor]
MSKILSTSSLWRHFARASTILQTTPLPPPPPLLTYAHTDIKVPDWTPYRRKSGKNPTAKSSESVDERRLIPYMVAGAGLTIAAYGTKSETIRHVVFMAPSAEVLALAKIEINLEDIGEGKNATFKWRGKPLFIKHRTPEQIEIERNVDVSTLRDPEHDSDRVKDPEWLVVIGVCTHLGCVPIADSGDWGGYYCPCHGSHYDHSGRIRKGPAPTNLEVPEYKFTDECTLVVG